MKRNKSGKIVLPSWSAERWRRKMDESKLTPEKAAEINARIKVFVGDGKPLKVESSISTPEGLRLTCKDDATATRLYNLMLLMTPEITHTLYEIHGRVVLLKTVPEWPNPLPERGQFDTI